MARRLLQSGEGKIVTHCSRAYCRKAGAGARHARINKMDEHGDNQRIAFFHEANDFIDDATKLFN